MKRGFKRSVIGALAGFVIFSFGYTAVTRIYYYVLPGSYWVDYYYAHVDNLSVGEDVALTLCRSTHYDNFKLQATRSFIFQLQNGRQTAVGEYDFAPTINASDQKCQTIQIPAKRQPQEPGTYQLRTTATFYVEGNRKTIDYVTNQYQVSDTSKSLELRIQRLQDELNQLRIQRGESPVDVTNGTSSTSTSTETASATTSPVTTSAVMPPVSQPTTPVQQPTVSEPPDPSLLQTVMRTMSRLVNLDQ